MPKHRHWNLSWSSVVQVVIVTACLAILLGPSRAAAQAKGKVPRDTASGNFSILACNPDIGCTAGDRPSVWFNRVISGTIRSGAAVTDTVHWCDDGGLTSSSRLVKQNATTLSSTYSGSSRSGCWQHATSVFTFTPVVGSNTIFASINDNFSQNGSAQFTFTYDSLLVAVTPKNSGRSKPTVSYVSDTFTVQNYNTIAQTYTLTPICSNAGTLACSAPASVTVGGSASSQVVVSHYTRGWNSIDTVSLRATSPGGNQSDVGSIIITASQNAITANFASNSQENQKLGLCANDCFTTVVSHSTASYRSLGVERSVSLVYHGDRTAVRPFVSADIALPVGTTAPNEVRLQAIVNGVSRQFVNGDNVLRFSTSGWQGGKVYRVAGQLDLSDLATNMYSLQLTATGVYADHSEAFTSPAAMKMMVVNLRTTSTILPTVGWTIAGIQQLHPQADGTMLVVEGDGSGVYFNCTSYATPCAGPAGDYSKLVMAWSMPGPYYARVYPDSSKVLFDGTGRMVQSSDRWGNTSNITYDGNGWISTIGDPILPSHFWFVYNSGFFSITLPRPNGGTPADTRPTYVAYNASGHITAFTDADANNTQFTYDGYGRIDTLRNRLGEKTLFFYDASSWKLDSIAMPPVPIDGQPQPQRPTVRMRSWQRVGVPTTSTASTLAIAPKVDTIYGLVVGAIQETTKFTADAWGQPLKIIDPLGNTTSIVRTGIFATTIVDHLGDTSSFGYTNGLLTSATPHGQPTTSISYDAWAMPSQISGGNNPTVTRSFSASPNVITTTIAGAYVSKDSLDSRGRVVATVDPANHVTRFHYDAVFGNRDSTRAHAGQWARTVMDGYGRDSAMTALGRSAVVRRIYDVLGRDSLVYDGVNAQPVKYSYNALYLTTVRDQKGQVYKQDLNALGWPTVTYDPADTTSWARKTSMRYDLAGRVTSWKNRRDSAFTITQQYDKLGRLTSQRDGTGTADSLWYSADGRTLIASNAVSVDTIKLGDRGADSITTVIADFANRWFRRVHSATEGTTTDTTFLTTSLGAGVLQDRINFWSQSRGVLDSLFVGGSRYRQHYNNELMPDSLMYPGALYRIDSMTTTHQIYSRRYSDALIDRGFSRQYAYDSLGRISVESQPSATVGSTVLRSYGYAGTGALSWYKGSLISSAFSCSGGFGCGYTGGTVTNVWLTHGYGYDPVSNLTSQVDSLAGNALTSGGYGAGNRVASWGADSYTYDLDGNRATRGSTKYTWSATGKLLKVANGADSVEYAYNALGELVRRKTNGVIDRYFVWDGAQLILLLDGAGQRIAEYSYLPGGEPLTMTVGGLTYNYRTDLRGNVIGVDDASSVRQQINYSPWGNIEGQSGFSLDTTRLGWKANVWESGITGLYYVHNRWYDPTSRSFISQDPIGLAGGLNTYAYTDNDPINYYDPLGLKKWCALWLCFGTGGDVRECPGIHYGGFGVGLCGLTGEAGGGDGGRGPRASSPPVPIPDRPDVWVPATSSHPHGGGGGGPSSASVVQVRMDPEMNACLLDAIGNGLVYGGTTGFVLGARAGLRAGFAQGMRLATSRLAVRTALVIGAVSTIASSEAGGVLGPIAFAGTRATEFGILVGGTTVLYTTGYAVVGGVTGAGANIATNAAQCATNVRSAR